MNNMIGFLILSAIVLQNVTLDAGVKQILFIVIFILGVITTFGSFLGLHL